MFAFRQLARWLIAPLLLSVALCSQSQAASQSWTPYPLPEYGFSVELPAIPTLVTNFQSSGDSWLTSYQALDQINTRQFTIFIGQPQNRGILETASMDAFLDSHLKSIVGSAISGKVQASSRITFLGMPALEYSYSQLVEGIPVIAQGITFIIDGGYMRLSMWRATSDLEGEATYQRFIKSFKLLPIKYRPSSAALSDPRGLSFYPPLGWVKQTPVNSYEVARYSNLTRSMALRTTGNSNYTCKNYVAELERAGNILEQSQIRLGTRAATKTLTFEDVPKYSVRLTTAHYCLDTKLGAVVLFGSEEQSIYWRWAGVYEATAASVRIQ